MMKNRNFKIHIEEPCRVNKENFTPTAHGFFCASCQKCVVDYTQYSDQELARSMSRPQASSCGIFTKEQLDKVYRDKPQPQAKARSLPALLLSGLFLTGHSLQAQEEPLVDSVSVVKEPEDTMSQEVLEAAVDTLGELKVVSEDTFTTEDKEFLAQRAIIDQYIYRASGEYESMVFGDFVRVNDGKLWTKPFNVFYPRANPVDTITKFCGSLMGDFNRNSDVPKAPKKSERKEKPLVWLSNLISKRFKKEDEGEGGAV